MWILFIMYLLSHKLLLCAVVSGPPEFEWKEFTTKGTWSPESFFAIIWDRFWKEMDLRGTRIHALGRGHFWGSKEDTRWWPLDWFEKEPLTTIVEVWVWILRYVMAWSISRDRCKLVLIPKLMDLSHEFCSPEAFSNVWRHLWLLWLGRMLLASRWWKLPNVLQGIGQLPIKRISSQKCPYYSCCETQPYMKAKNDASLCFILFLYVLNYSFN